MTSESSEYAEATIEAKTPLQSIARAIRLPPALLVPPVVEDSESMALCLLTDRELSGAPEMLTREADRTRPTRPLERLVRPQDEHRPQATTTIPERKRGSK